MTKMHRRLPTAIFLLLLLNISTAFAGPAVDVEAPWIREAPPASTVVAAYMVLRNTTDTPCTITGFESPDFRDARIHRTVVEDGVAKMLAVDELQLPANGSVTLEPGGLHLMLFNPSRSLHEGDFVTLVIHDSNGVSVTVQAPVVRNNGEHEHAHHH